MNDLRVFLFGGNNDFGKKTIYMLFLFVFCEDLCFYRWICFTENN